MSDSNDSIFLDGTDFPALVQQYLTEHGANLKPRTAAQYKYFLSEALPFTRDSALYQGKSDLRESRRILKDMPEPSRVSIQSQGRSSVRHISLRAEAGVP